MRGAVADSDPISYFVISQPRRAIQPERGSWLATAVRVPRQHRLFCAVLAVAAIVRVIVMLGYPPALWFSDSLAYISVALNGRHGPFEVRPVGYSFFLWTLRPFHAIALVTALQHAMGMATGTAIYALLRHRFRLRAWAATLASVPALLSAYAIQIEHFVLSDTLFALLVTVATVLLLWRKDPPLWICALSGLILAAAALDRSQGLALILPFVLYTATRVPRGRVLIGALAMCAIYAAPLLGYAWWFDQDNGSFQLTTSTGAFLYSRVAAFANCSVIKPAADERWLCLSTPVGHREYEAYYVWASQSPIQHGPGPEFGAKVNRLATDFALRAIEAQPSDYLRTVWNATMETFEPSQAAYADSLYVFPAKTPESVRALAAANYSSYQVEYNYNSGDPDTRVAEPFARWVRFYQRFIVLSPAMLSGILLTGLIGMPFAWRRFGGPVVLPWLTGVAIIVVGPATADYDSRYVIASIPMFCIAAALSLKEVGDFYANGTVEYPVGPGAPEDGTAAVTAGGGSGSAEDPLPRFQ